MARSTVPSFVRDPNQAVELAALIRDAADQLEREHLGKRESLSRIARTQVEQAIERYRGWAAELAGDQPDAEPVRPPLQIRPAANDG